MSEFLVAVLVFYSLGAYRFVPMARAKRQADSRGVAVSARGKIFFALSILAWPVTVVAWVFEHFFSRR